MDDSKFIHSPFHTGDGQQVHHLWGEEAQKGKNSNKNRKKRAYRGIRYIKNACVCTTMLPLFQDNYPKCAPQGALQALQDKNPRRQPHLQPEKPSFNPLFPRHLAHMSLRMSSPHPRNALSGSVFHELLAAISNGTVHGGQPDSDHEAKSPPQPCPPGPAQHSEGPPALHAYRTGLWTKTGPMTVVFFHGAPQCCSLEVSGVGGGGGGLAQPQCTHCARRVARYSPLSQVAALHPRRGIPGTSRRASCGAPAPGIELRSPGHAASTRTTWERGGGGSGVDGGRGIRVWGATTANRIAAASPVDRVRSGSCGRAVAHQLSVPLGHRHVGRGGS